MRLVVCLLFALAAACGTYALGAIVWSAVDPEHAGVILLFTIPLAIAAAALPALLGIVALIFRCDWHRRTRRMRPPHAEPSPAPAPAPAPASWTDDEPEIAWS